VDSKIKTEEKSEVKKLKDTLLLQKKHVGFGKDDSNFAEATRFCEKYKDCLSKYKTERECVKGAVEIAKRRGFTEFDASKKYSAGSKVYLINREKAVIFAVIGNDGLKSGAKIIVAHVDSPRLDLKLTPLCENDGLVFLKSHYYGGIKKYQWTTIPLALHGVIAFKNGEKVEICLGESESDPCFVISDLLPHLAREQMKKPALSFIEGEDLKILSGGKPYPTDEKESGLVKLNTMKLLNESYGITEVDFASADIEFVPTFKARDIGFDKSFVAGYGQDDRCCAFGAVKALMETETPKDTCIVALVDKEEIGSDGNTGAKSLFLRNFISNLAKMEGLRTKDVISKSKCISADVDAAYDPNYSSAFDPTNSSYLNYGVVLTKHTGSGGKYSSSEASAEFTAYIREMFDKKGIKWQTGGLGKIDAGGGGTVAKYLAQFDMDVIDVGVPVLSMHSPFEVTSKIDLYEFYKAMKVFLK
jgi:aspartyl aminopeptidase